MFCNVNINLWGPKKKLEKHYCVISLWEEVPRQCKRTEGRKRNIVEENQQDNRKHQSDQNKKRLYYLTFLSANGVLEEIQIIFSKCLLDGHCDFWFAIEQLLYGVVDDVK